jgi:hypothetical protein
MKTSNTRDGTAVSDVHTRNHSPVTVVNNVTRVVSSSNAEHEKAVQGIIIIIGLFAVMAITFLSSLLPKNPEQWMDAAAATKVFTPTDKKDYDELTSEVKHLQQQLEETQKELLLKSNMTNVILPADRMTVSNIKDNLLIAREQQQIELNHIIKALMVKLRAGDIVARGYENNMQKWVCPLPEDWDYLNLSSNLDPIANSTSITWPSGQIHLTQVKFRKPPTATVSGSNNRFCQDQVSSALSTRSDDVSGRPPTL